MKPGPSNIEASLLEVRKAYRLLHEYQRMVMDAASYVGQQLGFDYAGGYSKFSATAPGQGRGQLKNWAWDWLNFIEYEFHFTRRREEGSMWLSILLISDTGYFCSKSEEADKRDVDSFLPVEEAGSKVGFLLSNTRWPEPTFMRAKDGMKTFIEGSGELPLDFVKAGVIGRCWSLARLASEDEANRVVDDLVIAARENGIRLERVERKAV